MLKTCRKKLYLIFSLLTLLVIVSCVPVVTQTSAICAANQTFNSTFRKCETIVSDTRYVPALTLSSDTLTQETSKLINLTYTDRNGDAAISCNATSVTSQIETYSPILFDGRLYAAVDSLYDASVALSTLLTATLPYYNRPNNVNASANTAENLVSQDVLLLPPYTKIIKKSVVRQTIADNLNNFKTKVDTILTNSVYFVNNATIFPSEATAIKLVQTRLTELTSMMTFMDNHCYCSGGYCSTQIVSKMREYGTAAFIYSITDRDGESAYKSVAITIPAVSASSTPQYAPTVLPSLLATIPQVADLNLLTFAQSDSSTRIPQTFQLQNNYGDYYTGLSYTFKTTTAPANGSISCISSGLCTYLPTSGNLSSCPVSDPKWYLVTADEPVATAADKYYYNTSTSTCMISSGTGPYTWGPAPVHKKATGSTLGIDFSAQAYGTNGNYININFYNLHQNNVYVDSKASPSENFGLVASNFNTTNEGYVRVIGNTINVFINPELTTKAQVESLINSDVKANKLIVASVITDATLSGLPANLFLTGGVDEFDKFSYVINNGISDSAPADILIKITHTDHAPIDVTSIDGYASATQLTVTTSNPATILENNIGGVGLVPFTLDISRTYNDVDSVPSSCRLSYLDTSISSGNFIETAPGSTCTCVAGDCKIGLTAKLNLYGTSFPIIYEIESITGGKWSLPITRNLIILPVNNYPYINDTSLTVTKYATGITSAATPTTENAVRVPSISGATATLPNSVSTFSIPESTSTDELAATLTFNSTQGGGATESTQSIAIKSVVSNSPNVTVSAPVLTSLTAKAVAGSTTLVLATTTNFPSAGSIMVDGENITYSAISGTSLTVTATINEHNSGAVVNLNSFTITPTLNWSSPVGTPVELTVTIQDSGGTTNTGSVDTTVQKFLLNITSVNDYPYFTTSSCNFNKRTDTNYCLNSASPAVAINCVGSTSPVGTVTPSATGVFYWDAANTRCYKSISTSNTAWIDQPMAPSQIEANEGDTTLIDFTISEDLLNTSAGNSKGIYISSITSDNQTLLPDANIKAFYDLNDNRIFDSGSNEQRYSAASTSSSRLLETAIGEISNLHKLFLIVTPVTGFSGNANITLTIYDDGTPVKTTVKKFSFLVHSISSRHGGWTNIAATGIKTDKFDNPVSVKTDSAGAITISSDIRCNYNTTSDLHACTDANGNVQSCVGASGPSGTIIPQSANVLYWDSANKKCYLAQSPPDKFSWIEMNSTCPITRISGGDNWIADIVAPVSPATSVTPPVSPVPTTFGQFVYDPTTKICLVSTGASAWSSTAYIPAKVTLSWNPFDFTGTGADANVQIAGWNVYRRENGQEYNFNTGFLTDANSTTKMTIASPGTRTFTDNTAIAGTVYYYTVRPVDSIRYIATPTLEVFSEVRVIAPPANYAFAHRWMINQEICNGMNMTTTTTSKTIYTTASGTTEIVNQVDPIHNYRCPYIGPGDSSASGYYDYGKDLLVDISEAGCPYSTAACAGSDCVGISTTPTFAPTVAAAIGKIYYNRANGSCWKNTDNATGWVLYDGSLPTLDNYKLNSAMNPPLTNITNANAVAACTGRTAPTISGMAALLNADLPEKKDYMAYSSAPVGMLDPQISELEQGFSLDIQSRCNGSSASGVTAGYTDLEVPPSAYKYSIPGTATSGIRSVVTGSVPVGAIFSSTESCVSRFGVQDVYGNVAEWVKDQMYCNGNTSNNPFTCTTGCPISNPGWNLPQASEPLATTAGQYYYDTTNSLCKKSDGAAWIAVTTLSTDMHYNFGTSSVSAGGSNPTYYGLDNITGPFNDADASGHPSNGDIYLTDWDYVDRLYSAGNFSFPLGLPIHTDIETIATNISTWLTSGRAPTLLNIGVGITAAQLHGDGIIVNAYDVVTKGGGSTGSGNFAVGGSYKSGTRSGRFTMELVPTSTDTRNDIGFRCIIPVTNGKYTTDSKHPYGY